jgi:hypothetical protein
VISTTNDALEAFLTGVALVDEDIEFGEPQFDLGSVVGSALRLLSRGDLSQQSRIEIISPYVPEASGDYNSLQHAYTLGTVSIRFTHINLVPVSSNVMQKLQLLSQSIAEFPFLEVRPCQANTQTIFTKLAKSLVDWGSMNMRSKLLFKDQSPLPIRLEFSLLVEAALSYASASHFMHPGTARFRVIGRINLSSVDQALVWGFPFIVSGCTDDCDSLADYQAAEFRLQAMADALSATETGLLLSCIHSASSSRWVAS